MSGHRRRANQHAGDQIRLFWTAQQAVAENAAAIPNGGSSQDLRQES
jgi:hypothetical protein